MVWEVVAEPTLRRKSLVLNYLAEWRRRKRQHNQYAWSFNAQENITNQVSISLWGREGFLEWKEKIRSPFPQETFNHPPLFGIPHLKDPHHVPSAAQARNLGIIKFHYSLTSMFILTLLAKKVWIRPYCLNAASSSGRSPFWFPTTASQKLYWLCLTAIKCIVHNVLPE